MKFYPWLKCVTHRHTARVCSRACVAIPSPKCMNGIAKMKIAIITLAITIMCRKFDNKTLRSTLTTHFFRYFFLVQIGMLFRLFEISIQLHQRDNA